MENDAGVRPPDWAGVRRADGVLDGRAGGGGAAAWIGLAGVGAGWIEVACCGSWEG